jgi:hypothetical protein
VEEEPTFTATPIPLFETHAAAGGQGWHFDVGEDAERFLFRRSVDGRPHSLTVVLNWASLIED